MKTKVYLFMLVMASIVCVSSCSKDDEDTNEPNQPNNNGEQVDNTTYLKESDLYGVWAVNGNGSDKYFILFTETGKYSFCFNSSQMGGGTYSLDKNKLCLINAYLNTKDILDIEKDGDKLKITGNIYKFKSSSKEPINIVVFKTNKQLPISKTGEVFKIWGLHVTYGDVITYIKYETDYLINYQYCKDNSLKQVISEQNWFYVFNDDMTYTQDCSGNGNVVIYKLKDHYSTLKSQIVKQ